MAGYKRVNFYELCRLCATNQLKDKTHIFQEEGRKIQLQNKIQSCLSLNVCENDFLPKVVCSKCLRTLEVCYSFRQECVGSERMLSSYFKNFRYTEDFKKSGKVYIKDTPVNKQPIADPLTVVDTAVVTTTASTNSNTSLVTQGNNNNKTSGDPTNCLPFYTLQLPVLSTTSQQQSQGGELTSSQLLNKIRGLDNYAKTSSNKNHRINITSNNVIVPGGNNSNHGNGSSASNNTGHVVVSANGEVLNIVDFDAIFGAGGSPIKKQSRVRTPKTSCEVQKSPPKNNNNKVAFVKIEDSNKGGSSVIFPTPPSDYQSPQQPQPPQNFYNLNILESGSSTVNLNVLNHHHHHHHDSPTVKNEPPSITSTGSSVDSPALAPPAVKMHVCDICQKGFKRREHLYQHVKLHTGFRPYSCEHCHKSFMRKEHLLRHVASHSGLKNFTCEVCEKSFSRNDNLLKHKKTHDKQTSYTCDVCQKQFVMKHYYMAHKLTHESLATVWGNVGLKA